MEDNTKLLLDHLKSVHFAALATVFAILVVSSLGENASLQKAADQLSKVAGLNNVLTPQNLSKALAASSSDPLPGSLSVHEERTKVWWVVDDVYHPITENQYPIPRPMYWIPLRLEAYSPPHNYPPEIQQEPEKRTIRDFKETWQFMLNAKIGFVVTAIRPESTVFEYDDKFSRTPWVYSALTVSHESIVPIVPNPSHEIASKREFMVDVSVKKNSQESAQFVADFMLTGGQYDDPHVRPGRSALIPIEVRVVPKDLILSFLSQNGFSITESAQSDRPFSEVFPDLVTIAEGLDSLTVEELRKYIRGLLAKQGPEIELFGSKIPQEAIVYWSLPVLLIIQIYFLTTLGHILTHYKKELQIGDYPWIGMYQEPIAYISTWLSMIILPLAGGAIVIGKWSFLGGTFVKTMMALALFALIVATAVCIWRIVSLQRLRGAFGEVHDLS